VAISRFERLANLEPLQKIAKPTRSQIRLTVV
jgi:hypothetical protein